MYLLFVLILLELLCGAEVDLFVPSFPLIQKIYHLTPFKVELLMSINLVGYTISALYAGTLGDKFGRREVILWGLYLFVIGSLICSLAATFELIILGRFLQGLGIAGPAVLTFVIITDLYSVEKQQTLIGLFYGVVTLGMAGAPVLGSYITLTFGWRGNFNGLLFLGILCTLLSYHSLPKGRPNLKLSISLKSYRQVISSYKVILYALLIVGIGGGYWIFIALAPVFYMEDLQVSLGQFGFFQGMLAGVFALTCFTSPYFYRVFGVKACFISSIALLVFIMGIFLYMSWINIRSPYILTGVMCIFSYATIFPLNIAYPLVLDLIPEAKGRVSALLLSLRLIISALFIQGISFFYNGTFAPIGLGLSLCLLGAFWAVARLWPLSFPKETAS